MAYPLYIDISKDPRNSVVLSSEVLQSSAFNSPVIGDTIALAVQLLNGTSVADENVNGSIKVTIGNPGGTVYAYNDSFSVSESFWIGSVNTSTSELASALGTNEYINTYLEVEYTDTLTSERKSVCQLPIYVYNAVYTGSFSLTNLPQYLTLSESDARYVRQDSAPSGSFWIQTGNYLHLSEDTWSVGIGTTTPSEQLETTGNALFAGTVKSLTYFTGSFRGGLTGTASNALSSSYAATSSRSTYATFANSAAITSMSLYSTYANSADFASASVEADSASYANYAVLSRNAQYATSSISAGSSVTASYAITTSFAQSSRLSTTASYALTASYTLVSNVTSSTLFVSSASWASSSISSSFSNYARTASYIGSGSNNYMLKWSLGNTISTSSIVYDDNSKVGIGTASPQAKLHVFGPVSASSFGSGSLHGTASYALGANTAISSSYALSVISSSYCSYWNVDKTTVYTNVTGSSFLLMVKDTSSIDAAFFKYSATSGSNGRAGIVTANWIGATIKYADTSTTDIGATYGVTMSCDLSASYVRFITNVASGLNWKIKIFAHYL